MVAVVLPQEVGASNYYCHDFTIHSVMAGHVLQYSFSFLSGAGGGGGGGAAAKEEEKEEEEMDLGGGMDMFGGEEGGGGGGDY